MAVQNEWPWMRGQLDLWCYLIRFNNCCKYYDFHLNCYRAMTILRFFKYKYIRNQTGIAVKMVNPDSSFVQTWYGPHPQCYIQSPKAIGLSVSEKEIFKGVLPYMGMAGILIM